MRTPQKKKLKKILVFNEWLIRFTELLKSTELNADPNLLFCSESLREEKYRCYAKKDVMPFKQTNKYDVLD